MAQHEKLYSNILFLAVTFVYKPSILILNPLRNITAPSVVKNIKREWIGRHGVPNTLLTDQGQQVDGEEVREMCRDYNIKKKRSTPYHPEGDGISERHIGVMKGLFRSKLLQKKLPQRRWTEVLPDVQLAMNSTKHASTRYSPFELMFRENGNKGNRIPQQNEAVPEVSKEALVQETQYEKRKSIQEASKNLEKAADKMQE